MTLDLRALPDAVGSVENRGIPERSKTSSSTELNRTFLVFMTSFGCYVSEQGRFLALDLGGTNFRVLLVDLCGTEEPVTTSRLFLIPKRIMLGEGKHVRDVYSQHFSRMR